MKTRCVKAVFHNLFSELIMRHIDAIAKRHTRMYRMYIETDLNTLTSIKIMYK